MTQSKILYGGVLLEKAEREAINRVLDRNWWGLAEEGQAFEKEIAKVSHTDYALFVSSGSAALELAIASLKLQEGSEIIVPATTFPTPIASIIRNGLVPVVVDIGDDLQISPEAIEDAITDDTKAVLIVNVAGNIGDFDKYNDIQDKYNIDLIIDDCDGFGGTWDTVPTGAFGAVSTISTHAAHIIATGQGGVVFTNRKDLDRSVREMRDWGRTINFESGGEDGMPPEYQRYTYIESGYNYQPLELQAAMGRIQLTRLQEFKQKRKDNYWHLRNLTQGKVWQPLIHDKADPCWHTFPVLVEDRPAVVDRLSKAGIDWRPILAGNIARQPYYQDKVVVRGTLTKADEVFKKGIWLPVHPMHGREEMVKIASCITSH